MNDRSERSERRSDRQERRRRSQPLDLSMRNGERQPPCQGDASSRYRNALGFSIWLAGPDGPFPEKCKCWGHAMAYVAK